MQVSFRTANQQGVLPGASCVQLAATPPSGRGTAMRKICGMRCTPMIAAALMSGVLASVPAVSSAIETVITDASTDSTMTSLTINGINLLVGERAERERSEEHTSELQSRLHLVC